MEQNEKTDKTRHIRVWKEDHLKLKKMKMNMGFKNFAWVVHGLLTEQAENLATIEAVIDGRVPVVLTGQPLCDKTTFTKRKLLPSRARNSLDGRETCISEF